VAIRGATGSPARGGHGGGTRRRRRRRRKRRRWKRENRNAHPVLSYSYKVAACGSTRL